jgi:hypothetical protein
MEIFVTVSDEECIESIDEPGSMDKRAVKCLKAALVKKGFDSVLVVRVESDVMRVNASLQDGARVTLKIRCAQEETPRCKASREVSNLRSVVQRLGRVQATPRLVYTQLLASNSDGKPACFAEISFNNTRFFRVLCMEPFGVDGYCFQEWIRSDWQVNGKRFPDDLREMLKIVLQLLAYLHERCMALDGWKLSHIAFLPGAGMRLVLTDLACAVIGRKGKQYTQGALESSRPERLDRVGGEAMFQNLNDHKLAIKIQNYSTLQLLSTTQLVQCLEPEHPTSLLQSSKDNCDDDTTALGNCRAADLESVALNTLLLLTGEKNFTEERLAQLKTVNSVEKLAIFIGWPLSLQRSTVPRVLAILVNFLGKPESRKSASQVVMSKAMQCPILTQEQTDQSLGEGIVVPGGVTIADKDTGLTYTAKNLRLKHGKQGNSIFADENFTAGDFITCYAGSVNKGGNVRSKFAVAVNKGSTRLVAEHTSQQTLETYMAEKSVGHLLNSSRTENNVKKTGNVYLDHGRMFIDVDGNLRIPMFAAREIQKGEELLWDYDFLAQSLGQQVQYESDGEGTRP